MKKIVAIIRLAVFSLIVQMPCQADPSWPDSPEKQKMMGHCAELLLSSVDTNHIGLICSKITTNLPSVIRLGNQTAQNAPITVTLVTNENAIAQLKNFSSRVSLSLTKVATQLTASNVNTYLSKVGYCVTMPNPQGGVFCNFWSKNGPLKYFDVRSNTGDIIMSARFYENGKLKVFRENTSIHEGFIFNANGKLGGYNWITKDKVEVDVSFDDGGGVKIRGFILSN